MTSPWIPLKTLAAIGLVVATAGAHASGTVRGSSSGGQQLYNSGKVVYARELACSSCPYAGRPLTADLARTILTDQQTFGALDPSQQDAVRAYFAKRVGVN